MSRANIPVRVNGRHVRFVTAKQSAGEIAGRVLRPEPGVWRTAIKLIGPDGPYWSAYYVVPKDSQREAWENRPRAQNHSIQREFAH